MRVDFIEILELCSANALMPIKQELNGFVIDAWNAFADFFFVGKLFLGVGDGSFDKEAELTSLKRLKNSITFIRIDLFRMRKDLLLAPYGLYGIFAFFVLFQKLRIFIDIPLCSISFGL